MEKVREVLINKLKKKKTDKARHRKRGALNRKKAHANTRAVDYLWPFISSLHHFRVQFSIAGHSTGSGSHSGSASDSGHHNRCPPHAVPNAPSS